MHHPAPSSPGDVDLARLLPTPDVPVPGALPPLDPMALRGLSRLDAAWQVLRHVPDPEVPVLSLVDLGIVRAVEAAADGSLQVTLTPTYSGCPATEVIERSVVAALGAQGLGPATVQMQRSPAWTTDWIGNEARDRLKRYGIAPPGARATDGTQPIRLVRRDQAGAAPAATVPCPHCGSTHTETLAAFGATACKSLHRCLDCREPFEHFKAI